ncbi:hypothetical protein E4U22_003353 [Claviceps purpurea]|nr:hypothetical protein E4U22_003353 [Claviceps purpurea]
MAATSPPKRRFAPVPLETTFQSVRKNSLRGGHRQSGPIAEPTPEPSPQSSSPPISQHVRLKRRFKPQLIETSRRTRRVGDPGPATRPTDKTDITPYTNHIYAARSRYRKKHGETIGEESPRHCPSTRRESEDETVKDYLLEIAAREASRQMVEEALAAFPNSRAREGGVAHFYFRESSGSDKSAEESQQNEHDDGAAQSRSRRKSSDLGLNWWQKHMQTHAQQLAHERGDEAQELDADEDTIMRTDSDLDRMELPVPPDPLWTTSNRIRPDDRRESMAEVEEWEDVQSSFARSGHDGPALAAQGRFQQPQGDDDAARGRAFHDQSVFGFSPTAGGHSAAADRGRPFGAYGAKPEDPKRPTVSPPMLGKDLTFRLCPSPKQTKLETDHPFFRNESTKHDQRDVTGQGGLWQGYCFRSESNAGCYVVPSSAQGPNMLVTPYPPGSPRDHLTGGQKSQSITEEPKSMLSSSSSSSASHPPESSTTTNPHATVAPRTSHPKPSSGLHLLHGLDDRLRREKAQLERDEKIASEFGDDFVTQVYNYLSLGYPAMAHSFDEELSKISRVSVEDLCQDDAKQMAKGHIFEMNLQETPEEERCPRWKALRIYIGEWARQHPNLDNLDGVAWGVRERRGSWAI